MSEITCRNNNANRGKTRKQWHHFPYVTSCQLYFHYEQLYCALKISGTQLAVGKQKLTEFASPFSTYITVNSGYIISPSGISDLCDTVAGMVTPKTSMSTEGETLKFLSYITGARYVHPWWRGRWQSFNQVPATHTHSGHSIEVWTQTHNKHNGFTFLLKYNI